MVTLKTKTNSRRDSLTPVFHVPLGSGILPILKLSSANHSPGTLSRAGEMSSSARWKQKHGWRSLVNVNTFMSSWVHDWCLQTYITFRVLVSELVKGLTKLLVTLGRPEGFGHSGHSFEVFMWCRYYYLKLLHFWLWVRKVWRAKVFSDLSE